MFLISSSCSDDEYRLLRQSLFDRFAGNAVVPQEEAIVPAARARPRNTSAASDSRRESVFLVLE
jgi:hypothetical protein